MPMKNCHRLLIALISMLFMTSLHAQSEFAQRTDSLLNYLYGKNRFSGSILVAEAGKTLYQRDFNVSPNGNNEYAIGSQSKMFTAVIFYQLAEEHVLSLNDKLSKYYPTIPNADEITLYQMLSHESGIHDLINDDGFDAIKYDTLSEKQIVEYISKLKPAFDPGEDADYSNSNYILLGYIAQQLTGQTLTELLNSRIIGPLGLKDTYNRTLQTTGSKLNTCYVFTGSAWQPVNALTNPVFTDGAGSVISSVYDMQKFMTGLFNGKLIDTAMLDSMTNVGSNSKSMAHGIFLAPFYDHQGYGHTGHIDEYYSASFYMTGDSMTISFCSNGLNYDMNSIFIGILSYYYGKDFTFPEINVIKLSEAELQAFAGNYRLKLFHFIPLVKVRIDAADGVLQTAEAKNFESDKVIAEPVGPHTFKSYTYGSELEFIYKKNGKIKGCELHQGKTVLFCRRLRN